MYIAEVLSCRHTLQCLRYTFYTLSHMMLHVSMPLYSMCVAAGQNDPKYELKGLTVTLKPNIAGQPDLILWKHNGDKVVEFNGQEQEVYRPYENRITLDWVSAELDVTNLRFEDSGEYELDAYIKKVLHRSQFLLEVIGMFSFYFFTLELIDQHL